MSSPLEGYHRQCCVSCPLLTLRSRRYVLLNLRHLPPLRKSTKYFLDTFKMAALRPVHRLNNEARRGLHRERVFRDGSHAFEIYDDVELYMRYRFRHADIMNLVDMVGDNFSVAERKDSLTPTLQVLIALRFFACGSFQLVVGDLFGVSKATISRTIHRVAAAFARLVPRHVRFHPQRETEAMKVMFHAVAKFPNVIGCVDCTHVKIATPAVNEHEYVNRKNDHAINVQLICDADASIINCVVHWPGSVHDARILRESPVIIKFETMPRPLERFILGDRGYMLRDWLLTPYIHVANAEQQCYNDSHCATRCIIERCNGILKKRWHCLHTGLRYTYSFYSKLFTVSWVVAGCQLGQRTH